MTSFHADLILKLARGNGLLRTGDVDSAGAPRAVLGRLTREGRLVSVARGLYALPNRVGSEHDSLAEISAKNSTGVICLITALRFHGLTTHPSISRHLAGHSPQGARSTRCLSSTAHRADVRDGYDPRYRGI